MSCHSRGTIGEQEDEKDDRVVDGRIGAGTGGRPPVLGDYGILNDVVRASGEA